MAVNRPAYILPVIICSQFAGASLWFAGNAVIEDLQAHWGLGEHSLGYVTSAVQLGFIIGTLVFAFMSFADRFSPRLVFLVCSLAGALANAATLVLPGNIEALLMVRFATGFFLAGIYPVGMKIAAAWYDRGLGRALGYLVGALVLGTAFPHLLRGIGTELPWQQVLLAVSLISVSGGVLMYWLVPDGPYLPGKSRFDPTVIVSIFRSRNFRASSFGYFGHMWELYAFWAFLPVWLVAYNQVHSSEINVPLWSFCIIAAGFIGCAGGGLLTRRIASSRVATTQLLISGMCCVVSPILFLAGEWAYLLFLMLWGATVIGDSPQFSTLNATFAPKQYVGSALTIVNSIGFLITVVSIQLLSLSLPLIGPHYLFWILVPGPVLGLIAMYRLSMDGR